MSVQTRAAPVRINADDRARAKQIAASVGRASRVLQKQSSPPLTDDKVADLQALGMLAVWRKLPTFDPNRAAFDRWALYQALHAMLDAAREQREESLFEGAVRRGAQGAVINDDRPAVRDTPKDAADADTHRLRGRTRAIAATAWLQAEVELRSAGAPIERTITATEAVQAVREEMGRLTDEQRTYLTLRFWNDTEVQDIARQIKVPERTLRRRWAETREAFVARLRARGIFGIPEGFGEAVDALAMAAQKGPGP